MKHKAKLHGTMVRYKGMIMRESVSLMSAKLGCGPTMSVLASWHQGHSLGDWHWPSVRGSVDSGDKVPFEVLKQQIHSQPLPP